MLTAQKFAGVLVSIGVIVGPVTLAASGVQSSSTQAPSGGRAASNATADRLGANVRDVTLHLARTIQLPNGAMGALVLSVANDGAADRGGVKPGDVIVRFSGERVGRTADLNELVAKAPAGQVPVMVVRMGHLKMIRLELR